jgi:hypothetical protein
MSALVILSRDPVAIVENNSLFVATRHQWWRRLAVADRAECFRVMDEIAAFHEMIRANWATLSPDAKDRVRAEFED